MIEDQLLAARRVLKGAIFYEVALSLGGVSLICQARDRANLRLNADAAGDPETPVPNDAGLGPLNVRLVELVTPLLGLEIADIRRREDNAYLLTFQEGEELSLFRSSDDNVTDSVVSIYGPDLILLLD
ncbi:MAG: hypothetical protein JWR84_2216 [Caulobacter sp.]|nr:hypothetical protein [Caulobacter sp.]